MKQAKKIGIIYRQKGNENPIKYIAVLSGSYIYFYSDKKDIYYAEYYYVKNSSLEIVEQTLPSQKQFAFNLTNSVNYTGFGFDKESIMEDWMNAIRKLDESDFVSVIHDEEPK